MTVAGQRADAQWFLSHIVAIKLRGEEVGGAFSVVDMQGPPGDAPPLHRHIGVDEAFYVIDGQMTFYQPGRTTPVNPGDLFLAVRDIPHTFRVGDRPARWLAMCAPAGFERFVEALAQPARSGGFPPPPETPPDPEKLGALAAQFGIEILGPPGTLP